MNQQSWNRVEALFLRGLELGEEERERFLAEACGADEAVRGELRGLFEASRLELPPVLARTLGVRDEEEPPAPA